MLPRTENLRVAGQPCSSPQALASMEGEYVRRYWQAVDFNSSFYRANPRSIVVLFSKNRLLVLEDLGGAAIAKNHGLTSSENLRCAKISNQPLGRYVNVGPANGVARDQMGRGASADIRRRSLSSYAFLYPRQVSPTSKDRRLTPRSAVADSYQLKINSPTLLIEINYDTTASISDGVSAAIHESVHLFDQGDLWGFDPVTRDGVESRAYLERLQRNPDFSDELKGDLCLARDAIESIREFRNRGIDRDIPRATRKLKEINSQLIERQIIRSTKHDSGSMEAFWEFAEGVPQFLEQNTLIAQNNWPALTSAYNYYCNEWTPEIGLFYPLLTGSAKIRIQHEISSLSGHTFNLPEFSESGLRSFEANFYPDGPLTATESTTPISKLLCLQVGIFRSANAAATVEQTMDELGFAPVRRKAKIFKEDTAYRVEIGPLASDEEIAHYQQALRNLNYDMFRITCSEDS